MIDPLKSMQEPDESIGTPITTMEKYDSNPLFDNISDNPVQAGTADDNNPLLVSSLGSAFREGLQRAVREAPSIIEPVVEMSTEAIARQNEFLEKHQIDIDMPGKAVNINLKYLDAPEKVNQTIVDLANMMPEHVAAARRDVQTWDQTRRLAEELGLTPGDLLAREVGEGWNAESIYAARMMLATARDDVDKLAEKVNTRTATPEDLIEFRQMLGTYAGIQQQIHGLAAEAGRALNQFKIAAQSGELRKRQLDAMLDTYGHASTERLAELWSVLDDPAQKAKFAKDANNAKTIDMVLEYWINALLSAPSTHAVNILGNTLTAMWGMGEKAAAIGVSQTRMLFGGQPGVAPTELAAEFWGLYRGSMDGFKLAWQVLKTREPTDPLSKVEARKHQAITGESVTSLVNEGIKKGGKAASWMLKRDDITPMELEEAGWIGRGADALGTFIRYPGVALMAEDEFFKSVAYRMELNALAARQAHQEGLTGVEAADRITAILKDPPETMHVAAMDHAHYRTFTQKLGASSSIQKFLSDAPIFRFIMPFVRTPVNITKYSFERIPGLNLLVKRSREELFSNDPARRDIAMGKLAMGTMFMTASMPFISEHFENVEGPFEITGASPSDPALRSQWRRNHQEYSIRIGDEWYAYNRADPLGQMLGILADSVRIMRNADHDTLDEYSVAIVHAISNNLINKTYMSGIADFFEVFTSFDEQKWQKYVKRQAASFIPNIVRRAETQIDPTVRLTESVVEEFCARIPGCSKDLPPMRNLWGDPIESRAFGPEFVSPIFNMSGKYSAIDKELDRLQYPIRMPSRHMMGIKLNEKQYSDYVLLQGKQVRMGPDIEYADINISGLNMKEALTKLVTKSEAYKEGTDHVDPPGTKAQKIRNLVELYRQQAQLHMLKRNPEIFDASVVRHREKLEAQGYSPMDAARMGLEYSNDRRQTLMTDLESRVDE